MAVLLGVLCTAIAFLLYFRLIANVGPTKAITVTFLVPVFAVLFGALFIDEELTVSMITGGAVIMLGTALSTGLLTRRS
jgi:drug/metabolite transporter (DMT)-like permease